MNIRYLLFGLSFLCIFSLANSHDSHTAHLNFTTGELQQFDFLPGQRLVTQSQNQTDETLVIWATGGKHAGEKIRVIETGRPVSDYDLSPDKTRIVTNYQPDFLGSGNLPSEINIWDVDTGKHIQRVLVPYPVYMIRLTKNNTMLWYAWQRIDMAQSPNGMYKYDLKTKKTFWRALHGPTYMEIDRSGNIGVQNDGWGEETTLVNLINNTQMGIIPGTGLPLGTLFKFDFHSKSVGITTVIGFKNDPRNITLWDMNGNLIQVLTNGYTWEDNIYGGFTFNPLNVNELVSADSAGRIRIWDIEKGEWRFEKNVGREMTYCCVTTDGEQIASNVGTQTIIFPYPKIVS